MATPAATRPDWPSSGVHQLRRRRFGELLKDLSQQFTTLVRQEIDLAKAELDEKARTALPAIGFLAGAVIAALACIGALTAMLILALAEAMPGWAAALIVTALWLLLAAALAVVGRKRLAEAGTPIPEKTVETVKEDVEWLKNRITSEAR
jgi:uncharacterized membrane protein YqjE